MARIKSFFGCSDLKTGGVVIGWLSLFANIIYLIFDIELILLFNFEQTQEKKDLFGSYVNEINTSSPAFPIILFATIASLYGIIASALLLCGALCSNRKRVLWWLIYQPIAILSIIALAVYTVYLRIEVCSKTFFEEWIRESMYLLFLITILAYIGVHIYFFIVIIELYLEIKAAEPTPVPEDPEAKITKEEELQLLETPKVETADETDKKDEEKPADEEKKEEEAGAKKEKKNRCGKLNCAKDIFKCPSIGCPSIGNCVGPDHFE